MDSRNFTMEKKHLFTYSEKREFLKILKKYGAIIENKSCDGNTSRRKAIAWNRIACEYNTSSIAPYPATGQQLRRLWFNLKQRKKLSISKLEDPSTFKTHFPTDSTLGLTDIEEHNDGGENQDVSPITQLSGENTQENGTFIASDSDGRAFNVEFIDEIEEGEKSKPKQEHASGKEVNRVKNNLLVREYQDRRHRQNELHLLQKRLMLEQIREARAKANLAELELRQQHYLA